MRRNVAVIIPFYQREPGILRAGLESVLAQQLPRDVRVKLIVVDDESPSPPEVDLEGLAIASPYELAVLRQRNGGPGAARNAALESLEVGKTEIVAFLDSDDIWAPDHLARGLLAIESGFGMYFCDHTRFDLEGDWFSSLGTARLWLEPQFIESRRVSDDIAGFKDHELFDALLVDYVSQTSTIIYDFRANADLRFDAELRGAGEDRLMWLELASRNRCAVGLGCHVHCDKGVNVYAGAMSWASSGVVDRYGYIALFLLKLRHAYFVSDRERPFIQAELRKFLRAYSYLYFRALFLLKPPRGGSLKRLLRRSPAAVAMMPLRFVSVWPRRKTEALTW